MLGEVEEPLDGGAHVGGGGGEAAGDGGGDVAAPGDPGGGAVLAEEALGGLDDLEGDRDGGGGGLAGEAGDGGVGLELAAGAVLAAGPGSGGGLGEGGHDRGVLPVGDGEAELGHAVGQQPAGDPAAGVGVAASGEGGLLVEAQHDAAGFLLEAVLAEALEGGGVGGDLEVGEEPVLAGEVAGLGGDDLGAALGEVAALQGGVGVGEVVEQGPGQGEVAAASVGGLAAGQPDLGAEAGVVAATGAGAALVELVGQPCLGGGGCGLDPLEGLEVVDAGAVVAGRLEVGEHVDQAVERVLLELSNEGVRRFDHAVIVSNIRSNEQEPSSRCGRAHSVRVPSGRLCDLRHPHHVVGHVPDAR